jgi:hypothetical protein
MMPAPLCMIVAARDTGGLSRRGTIVAMCRADHADQALDVSTFG